MKNVSFKPIGVIHSPFQQPVGMPVQPSAAAGVLGIVEIHPEFEDGLQDIEGFSHIVLIYHLHLSRGFSLLVKPYLDDQLRGVFATRAPKRPNPIGLSVVRLESVRGCTLHIRNVDVVDGTPLLDLKPYVPELDLDAPIRLGWLSGKLREQGNKRSDDRFYKNGREGG